MCTQMANVAVYECTSCRATPIRIHMHCSVSLLIPNFMCKLYKVFTHRDVHTLYLQDIAICKLMYWCQIVSWLFFCARRKNAPFVIRCCLVCSAVRRCLGVHCHILICIHVLAHKLTRQECMYSR